MKLILVPKTRKSKEVWPGCCLARHGLVESFSTAVRVHEKNPNSTAQLALLVLTIGRSCTEKGVRKEGACVLNYCGAEAVENADFYCFSGFFLDDCCVRMASDYRKRAYVQRETPLEDQAAVAPAALTVSHNLLPHELACLLEQALATLDEKKRATFVLYEIEGCTLAEIATITQTSVPTVHARLQAARRGIVSLVTANDEKDSSP